MKVCLKADRKIKQPSSNCTVTEYPLLGEKNIDFAIATLSGRYPENGFVINTISKELAYVSEGVGKLVIEGKTIELKSGDVLLIEAGEKYYWEGHMTLILSCTPAWCAEQHKLVAEYFVT